MSRTQFTGQQVSDSSVQRQDLDAVTAGSAVIKKVVAGTNITINSSGVDSGTGDVTINALGNPTFIQDAAPTTSGKYLWIQTNYNGGTTLWFNDGI